MFGVGNVKGAAGRWSLLLASFLALAGFSGCEDTQKVKTAGNTDPAIGAVTFDSALLWGTTVAGTIEVTGEPDAILTWTIDDPAAAGGFAVSTGTVTLDAAGAGAIAVSYTAPVVTGTYSYGLTVEGEDATGTAVLDLVVTRAGAALLLDPGYFEYDPGNQFAEASNLEETLLYQGFSVATIPNISAAGIGAAIGGKAAFVIPYDGLSNDYIPDFDAAALEEVRSFVDNGGLLLVIDDAYTAGMILNAVFGYSITFSYAFTATVTQNLQSPGPADGTPFESAPAQLNLNTLGYGVDLATFPAESKMIYRDGSTRSVVTLIPYGSGQILLLGWTWMDSYPTNPAGQDGGWLQLLQLAMEAAESESF